MKKRKLMTLLAVCSVSAMLLGGCGQTGNKNVESNNASVSTETNAETVEDVNVDNNEENDTIAYQDTTVSGRVMKIEANEITLQLMHDKGGERAEGMPENMEDGQMPPEMKEHGENAQELPEHPDNEMQTKEIGQNPREIPKAEVLDGKQPENMEDGQTPPEMPEENIEVFVIEDESLISLDELSEGDFISITFDKDGNMTEISKDEKDMPKMAPSEKAEDEA